MMPKKKKWMQLNPKLGPKMTDKDGKIGTVREKGLLSYKKGLNTSYPV